MARPAALLLLLAAAAMAPAPARAADLPVADIAAAFTGIGNPCHNSLLPPSAELEAAARACWEAINPADAPPPDQCPADGCRAFAESTGRYCWYFFHLGTNALRAALATALEGGKALPEAEAEKLKSVPGFLPAAALRGVDATAAAALRKEVAYVAALEVACRPAAPAANVPAAKAGSTPTYVEAVAEIYKDELPACKGVLFPASAEWRVAQSSCGGDPWWEAPAACPAKGDPAFVCAASALLWGAECLAEYNKKHSSARSAASAALSGGPALPAADVAKLQAAYDAILSFDPTHPALDWAATLEAGDTVLAAVTDNESKVFESLATVCEAEVGAGLPAAAAAAAAAEAAGPAAAPAEAASGARAPAAAAAAAALLALLSLAV
jgi:hypothetical protein